MPKYILLNKGLPVLLTYTSPWTGTPKMKEFPGIVYDEVKNADQLDSFAEAEEMALRITAITGRDFLACDNGSWTSHQFAIVEAPVLGEEVSYGFNGDSYHDGKIVRITPNWMCITESGARYNRKGLTNGWKKVGGTWWMLNGIHNEQNPHI